MAPYFEDDYLFPMRGGCPCGHSRYQLDLPPIIVNCCHCLACQRQTGSAFAINAVVERSAISILPPEELFPEGADSPQDSRNMMLGFATLTDSKPVRSIDPMDELEPADMDLLTIPSASGNGQTIAQCPECRTVLWNYYAGLGKTVVYLRVGTLDMSWEIDPDVHIFTASKREWLNLSDGKPQFEDDHNGLAKQCRESALPRVRALEKDRTA